MTEDGVPYGRRLTDLARERGDETALVLAAPDGSEREYGWAELEARANQVARAFLDAGVTDGDLVVVALRNSPEHVFATFAAWKVGASMLPLRWDLPAWERDQLLAVTTPSMVVADWPDIPGALGEDAIDATRSRDDTPIEGEHVPLYARLSASGGSTGTPKIIVQPSPGRFRPGTQVFVDADQVYLCNSPLYHVQGFAACYMPLLEGNRVVMLSRFDAARVVDLIERHRITRALFVPTMLQRIASLDGVRERDFSSLNQIAYGGAVLPEWVARTWLELVSPERFLMIYGGSESIGTVMCTGVEWLQRPGTTGRPIDCEVVVLGPDRHPLPAGEVGEVWMRLSSPGEPFRYIGIETPEPDAQGFRTFGDMGWLDEDGYLYISDRRQDMIVSGGANVFPAEVEAALTEHPGLADAVVIGLPDPEWGRRVHAVVVPADPSAPPSAEDLRGWCKQRLSGPKVPKAFEVVERLPRSEAGKINRSRLVAERTSAQPAG